MNERSKFTVIGGSCRICLNICQSSKWCVNRLKISSMIISSKAISKTDMPSIIVKFIVNIKKYLVRFLLAMSKLFSDHFSSVFIYHLLSFWMTFLSVLQGNNCRQFNSYSTQILTYWIIICIRNIQENFYRILKY